jgi:hypothetical protein
MDLDGLDADFNNKEIEVVIKSITNSHAPGLDDFNGLFIKKCWNIVKDDFSGFSDIFVHVIPISQASTPLLLL